MPKRAKTKSLEPAVTDQNPVVSEPQNLFSCEEWSGELGVAKGTLLRRLRRAGIESSDGKFSTEQVMRAMYGEATEHKETLLRLRAETCRRERAELERTHARASDLATAQQAFQSAVMQSLKESLSPEDYQAVASEIGVAASHNRKSSSRR
jgi:hypothetical protein